MALERCNEFPLVLVLDPSLRFHARETYREHLTEVVEVEDVVPVAHARQVRRQARVLRYRLLDPLPEDRLELLRLRLERQDRAAKRRLQPAEHALAALRDHWRVDDESPPAVGDEGRDHDRHADRCHFREICGHPLALEESDAILELAGEAVDSEREFAGERDEVLLLLVVLRDLCVASSLQLPDPVPLRLHLTVVVRARLRHLVLIPRDLAPGVFQIHPRGVPSFPCPRGRSQVVSASGLRVPRRQVRFVLPNHGLQVEELRLHRGPAGLALFLEEDDLRVHVGPDRIDLRPVGSDRGVPLRRQVLAAGAESALNGSRRERKGVAVFHERVDDAAHPLQGHLRVRRG